ncbi:MAG: PIN domain-containing protein [Myxococcota bacterium]|nr:PIN domain-containing protein [Myxococcota bacterium]
MKRLVLDAGALIALERRDPRAVALLEEIVRARVAAHVPAGVVAQVWRGSSRQHPIIRLLRADALRVHELTERVAYRVGLLLGASGASDVVDAHVAILGRALGAVVVTSDPDDLRRLDPELQLVAL